MNMCIAFDNWGCPNKNTHVVEHVLWVVVSVLAHTSVSVENDNEIFR